MASARMQTREREVMVKKQEKVVTLELSEHEAQVLKDVLGQGITGDGPRRRHLDEIWGALDHLGFTPSARDFIGELRF